ncbi:MAG: MFS transporter [Alphaproteobacteria bacterium]|nr:MFS transporter [Alphaproteobacteria bacterium]
MWGKRRDEAEASLLALNGLNFSVSAMQAGFGAFVPVRLAAAGWDPGAIGMALSVSTIASMAAQVPSGAVIDHFSGKRALAAIAIGVSMLALLLLATIASVPIVVLAQVMQGGAGVGLTLAIACVTLSLARQDVLGERLGKNVRYAAVGAAVGAAGLGLAGSFVSGRAVFLLAACFGIPALLSLRWIHPVALASPETRTTHHTAPPRPKRKTPAVSPWRLLRDRRILVFFACVVMFHLGNATLLPLAATSFFHHAGRNADLLTAVAVTGPQLITALLSPWVGSLAETYGRRSIMMLGFCAVPLRAVLFSIDAGPGFMLASEMLDGVSAATFGVMMPLVVADITHRGGRFNLTLGMMGLAAGLGATVSTSAGGWIADVAGLHVAFLVLAVVGCGTVLLIWALLPETSHLPRALPVVATRNPAT